ncbi:unnamed protein product [Pylaiella littoralis]
MDILRSFIFNNTQHDVCVIRDENDYPLFKASDIGNVLELSNVHTSIADFDYQDKVFHSIDTPGGRQATTFLTEQGALTLIMRSRKPIAKPFQRWVFDVIKKINETGKYELDDRIAENDEKHSKLFREYKDGEDERFHRTLVDGYDDRTLVYFGKIKTMADDRLLVKIGCTKTIRSRVASLVAEFGQMSIFKVFECDNQEPFERFLHGHPDITRYSYRELVNGMKKSHEVFCMTEEQLQRAINIASRNVSQFRVNKKRDFDDLVDTNPTVRALCEKVGIDVNADIDSMEVGYASKRGRCTLSGPKIQAYTGSGKDLVQTYETLLDAARDMKSEGASRSGIEIACNNKTVKYGLRWAHLEQSRPDDTLQDIGETVEDNPIHRGPVAALKSDKSEVVKVYTSFKACAIENGFKSAGAVQKRVNRGAKVGDHYMASWSSLGEAVRDKWLKNNAVPTFPRHGNCIRINRLDPVTRKVLRTYGTMDEVKTHFKIGQHSLKSAIRGDLLRHGFKWSYADQ